MQFGITSSNVRFIAILFHKLCILHVHLRYQLSYGDCRNDHKPYHIPSTNSANMHIHRHTLLASCSTLLWLCLVIYRHHVDMRVMHKRYTVVLKMESNVVDTILHWISLIHQPSALAIDNLGGVTSRRINLSQLTVSNLLADSVNDPLRIVFIHDA